MSYSPKLEYYNPFLWYTHLDLQALQELCGKQAREVCSKINPLGCWVTLNAVMPTPPSEFLFPFLSRPLSWPSLGCRFRRCISYEGDDIINRALEAGEHLQDRQWYLKFGVCVLSKTFSVHLTLRQWRTQVRFEIPAEIPTDYDNLIF